MKDQINEALRHQDPTWGFFQILGVAERNEMDRLIVEAQLPMAYQPGSQWSRFAQLHRSQHQF